MTRSGSGLEHRAVLPLPVCGGVGRAVQLQPGDLAAGEGGVRDQCYPQLLLQWSTESVNSNGEHFVWNAETSEVQT